LREIPIKTGWLHLSEGMIRTALRHRGYGRYIARRKPDVSAKNQEFRLAFATEHLTWTKEQWSQILWSDESWINDTHHRRTWVTRNLSEAYDPTCVIPKVSKKPGWMFWGSFHGSIKGPGLFWEKEWGTINEVSYSEHVVPIVASYIQSHPGLIFQQDNASGHRARSVREKFQELGVPIIIWPAYSPDLSPIEALWNLMKDWIEATYGDLEKYSLKKLRQIVAESWDNITSEQLDELIDTMPARCQAVIDAGGLCTKW
jgi:hypothetical protein